MSFIKYIIKRALTMIPVLFGAITVVYILSRFMPGDPVYAYLGPHPSPEEVIDMRRLLGFDQPLIVQFFRYLGNLFTGDWGRSLTIRRGMDVWELIWQRFPRTMELTILSLIIASVIGIKSGVISARHRNKYKDTTIRGISLVGVSIPIFWMGMILQYLLTYQIDLLPAIGFKTAWYPDPEFITGFRLIDSLITGKIYLTIDYLMHLILPVVCLAFITVASITRQTRSSMLEVLQQDYIRTARAKGCAEKDVIGTHALKNALIPTATVIGLSFGYLLSGAVLTETTFNLSGMGQLMITAIRRYDFYVINAGVFLVALTFILINLAMDVVYGLLDPRIRY